MTHEYQPALDPQVIIHVGASPDARARDCIAPTLLEYIALVAEKAFVGREDGYVILRPERASEFCHIMVATVANEVVQMVKRGTLSGERIGDGEWRVRVTEFGWAKLEETGR